VTGIKVTVEKCTGCGLCVDACPFHCITLIDKTAVISEECRLCGLCVDVCPTKAIEIEVEEKGIDVSKYQGVLVFGEQRSGVIAPVVYELIGKGRELADKLGERLECVVLGEDMEAQADDLSSYGVDRVYLFDPASCSSAPHP